MVLWREASATHLVADAVGGVYEGAHLRAVVVRCHGRIWREGPRHAFERLAGFFWAGAGGGKEEGTPSQRMAAARRALLLCKLRDVVDAKECFVGGETSSMPSVIVVRQDGDGVRAFVNKCPHVGTALNMWPDKFLSRTREHLLCATHGALFRKDDGYCVKGPCSGARLASVAVRVERDEAGSEIVVASDGAALMRLLTQIGEAGAEGIRRAEAGKVPSAAPVRR